MELAKSGHSHAHGYCFHALYTSVTTSTSVCEHVFKNPCDQANASNLNPRPQGSSQLSSFQGFDFFSEKPDSH